MNPIIVATKPKMKEIVEPIGFKCKGASFYRLMDGFVQSFKIYAQYGHCSIRFYMSPLCAGLDLKDEGEDISKFWTNSSEFIYVSSLMGIEMPTFYYEESDEPGIEWKAVPLETMKVETVEEAAEMLIALFQKYLMPWFVNSDTTERAFEAVFNFECNLNQRSHKADPEYSRHMVHKETERSRAMRWYSWMLQMRNYDKALHYIDIAIALQIKGLEDPAISLQDISDEKIRHQAIQRNIEYRNNYLSHLKNIRKRLHAGGMTYMNDAVRESTEQTLQNLKLKRVKVWDGNTHV